MRCHYNLQLRFRHPRRRLNTLYTMKYIIRLLTQPLTRYLLLTLMVASTAHANDTGTELSQKVILGWIENVHLQPSNLKAKAKLDTGAKTSSIHAKNIEYFEKDGDRWVRFQFSSNTKLKEKKYAPGKSKKVITIEAPLTRSALIKHHKHSSVERPVITLPFTLDGVEYKAEFTLTDRSKFLYPVLLGRRFLKNVAIVDPGNTFLRTRTMPADEAQPAEPQQPSEQAPDKTPEQKAAADSTTKTATEASNNNKDNNEKAADAK